MHQQENFEGHVDNIPHFRSSIDEDEALEPEQTEYQRDREINEKDFVSAQARAEQAEPRNESSIAQAVAIAKKAHITLKTSGEAIDPLVALYEVLRSDMNPGEKYHHMSDQRLFAEVLRMSGKKELVDNLREVYPNISFD